MMKAAATLRPTNTDVAGSGMPTTNGCMPDKLKLNGVEITPFPEAYWNGADHPTAELAAAASCGVAYALFHAKQ
jgi:hypothetical protein